MAEVDELWEELYRTAPRDEVLAAEDAHRMGAAQDRSDAISSVAFFFFPSQAREAGVPALWVRMEQDFILSMFSPPVGDDGTGELLGRVGGRVLL